MRFTKEETDAGPTLDQIKFLLQQSLLRHYPNPERKGCLDSTILNAIARQRLPHEDPRWRTTWGRALLFGSGYFVVTLFPLLGFFDQNFYQYSLVADHWRYYSIMG